MRIPSNMTKEELVETIDMTVKFLCRQYVHGCNDENDMYQWGWFISLEFLEIPKEKGGYDEVRPLHPVLRTHLKRRYLNMIRKSVRRSDPPCSACASGDYCTEFGPCESYLKWQKRNNDKAALSKPAIFKEENEDPPSDSEVVVNASIAEMGSIIDRHLSPSQRRTLLMAQDGCRDTLNRRRDLETVLEELTGGQV